MSHWTHFVTEADLDTRKAPEQWEVEEAWEAERVALCNADNEALESEAQSAELSELSELSGLMVCGADEWGNR